MPIQRVAKGALLNHPGKSDGTVHLVLLGRLKAYHVTADGDELLLELIDAGGFAEYEIVQLLSWRGAGA